MTINFPTCNTIWCFMSGLHVWDRHIYQEESNAIYNVNLFVRSLLFEQIKCGKKTNSSLKNYWSDFDFNVSQINWNFQNSDFFVYANEPSTAFKWCLLVLQTCKIIWKCFVCAKVYKAEADTQALTQRRCVCVPQALLLSLRTRPVNYLWRLFCCRLCFSFHGMFGAPGCHSRFMFILASSVLGNKLFCGVTSGRILICWCLRIQMQCPCSCGCYTLLTRTSVNRPYGL